jgi:exosortase family protein XrtF
MLRNSIKNPFIRFLVLAAGSYLAWYIVYHSYINVDTNVDRVVIDNLIDLSGSAMESMGYTLIPEPPEADAIRTVGIDGTYGLWIGDPCNGVTLFALFLIFMIWFPGPIKHKLWFIPFGLITIHLLNVVRIIALCIIVSYDYRYLDFNHNYTFTILIYGYMFILWILWVKKFSEVNTKQHA